MGPSPVQLERIRRVTDNYFFWQGLRFVPMGAALLVVGLRWSPGWPLRGGWSDLVMFSALGIALWASGAIGSYYRRSFGDVHGTPGAHQRRSVTKWLIVYPLMALSLILDGLFTPPVFISGPVWGAGILAYWWSTGRGRPHYLVAAALLAGFGLLPALGLVAAGRAGMGPFFAVLGGIYVVAGVLDHLALRRLLPPVKGDDDPSPV